MITFLVRNCTTRNLIEVLSSAKGRNLIGGRAVDLVHVGNVIRRIPRSHATEQQEDEGDHTTDQDQLAQHWTGVAKLRPLASGLSSVSLELVCSKLVVEHATQGNAVAEELQTADLSAPDKHGSDNEKDILQDSAEGEDERGGLADLYEFC